MTAGLADATKTEEAAIASFNELEAAKTKEIHAATQPRLNFIALALHGKKFGMEKVIKMIDEMVVVLKTEQEDDDKKKEYCAAEFDQADDKKKEYERAVSDA